MERARRARERRQAIGAPLVLALAVVVASLTISYPLWFLSTRSPRWYTLVVAVGVVALALHGIRTRSGARR